MNKVKVIGQMDNSADRTFESANRVYDVAGLCPTIPTGAGGGHMPKVLIAKVDGDEEKMSDRELRAKVTKKGIRIYQDDDRQSTASEFGTIQKTDGVSNAIIASNPSYIIDGKRERVIVAQRGRNPENPKSRRGGLPTEQRLEVGPDGVCNALTTVQKDNMVLERGEVVLGGLQEHQRPRRDGISPSITAACGMGGGQTPIFTERRDRSWRIRKLTPRECGRLMGVSDSDIDRMAAVNSNSQLYKQFGNSIVVDVMCAMFRKLNIRGGVS